MPQTPISARSASPRFSPRWLLLVILLLATAAAIAQSQIAVGRVELVIQLADRNARETTIAVRNESDSAVQAIVRLEDWDRSLDGTNRWYEYGANKDRGSCFPALSIFPRAIRLEPWASQTLRVVLDSASAPAGECWGAAVIETVQHGLHQGQGAAYVIRTAVKIYVESGDGIPAGEIEELKLVGDNSADASPRMVEVRFANTGPRHIVAQGTLEVRTPDNVTVRRIPLPPIYALPNARRVIQVSLPALPPGDYVLLAIVDYGGTDIAAALLPHRAQ